MAELSEPGVFYSGCLNEHNLRQHPHDIFQAATGNHTHIPGSRIYKTFYADNLSDKNGPYRVEIRGNGTEYMIINEARVNYKIRIVDDAGNIMQKYHDCSVATNVCASLWKSLNVAVNYVNIAEMDQDFYPYTTYLKNLTYHNANTHDTTLRTQLALYDHAMTYHPTDGVAKNWGSKDKYDADTKGAAYEIKTKISNAGMTHNLWKRYALFNDRKYVELCSPLHIDALESGLYFPPLTTLMIQFNRSPADFYMINFEAATNFHIEIMNLSITVPFVKLDKEIVSEHEHAWRNNAFSTHQFRKMVIRTRTFADNLTNLQFDGITKGPLPMHVTLFMINTEDVEGKKDTSPYYMQHLHAVSTDLRIDNQSYPRPPIQTDFTNGSTNHIAYLILQENLQSSKNKSNIITPDMFNRGYTMWAWDLNPDLCGGFHNHPLGDGIIDIEVKLKQAYTKAITMFVVLTYKRFMYMDQSRHLRFDLL